MAALTTHNPAARRAWLRESLAKLHPEHPWLARLTA